MCLDSKKNIESFANIITLILLRLVIHEDASPNLGHTFLHPWSFWNSETGKGTFHSRPQYFYKPQGAVPDMAYQKGTSGNT